MNLRRSCITTLYCLFVVTFSSSATSALMLYAEPELSPDSLAKILPAEEQINREFSKAKEQFAHSFFRMALSSIKRTKELAKKYNIETPSGLILLEQNCARGRMEQIELEIINAYHESDSMTVLEFAKEASKIGSQHKVIVPRNIIHAYVKMINSITETVFVFKKELKPDIHI